MIRFVCLGHAWTSDFGCSEKEEFHWLIKVPYRFEVLCSSFSRTLCLRVFMVPKALGKKTQWFSFGYLSNFHQQNCRFIHTFLGIGIALCAITCLGHIAAHTANRHCLSLYPFLVELLTPPPAPFSHPF
ncbi:hypothetical protein RHGRI_029142 [Rhododendron griersonianum]|uniref:Uncharacterized protein n=1 Tax=Rhododendron griersonianum TaxID=479676 RepID=A0AAV6IKA4_9ERIC|nr:hypothetical protein RHGRI_029142 [Rhododendron griersonianum]